MNSPQDRSLPVVEVKDTIGELHAEIARLREENARLESARQSAVGAHLYIEGRKAHYKGIVERAKLVLQAAWLLDEGSIKVEVLADALLGDDPIPPPGPRVRSF